MFMLRNVSKYIFGDTSKENLIDIQQGQLYLVRPLSPKGYSELIFRDAAASIRRTGQQYQYQLVIQRVYEEGEEELLADEEGEDSTTAGLKADKDEKTFLLDESLHFRIDRREGGETIFAWRDLSGDPGDLFEFVCDNSVQNSQVASFGIVAAECQYERKYRKSHENATEEELTQFTFEDEDPIPSASPSRHSAEMPRETMALQTPVKAAAAAGQNTGQTVAPPSAKAPESREVLADLVAELHLFDFDTGTFVLQDSAVRATVSEIGNFEYWLHISGEQSDWLGRRVTEDINPVFNFDYLSFIFNLYTDDGSAFSWLLRFRDQPRLERFQEGLMQALWEHLNKMKWNKVKEDDRDYVMDAFQDLTMEDAPPLEEEEEEEEEPEVEDADEGQRSEHYDSDESQDDEEIQQPKDGSVNSQLAVGYKHGRSFVVRGSKIGVFKHTPSNQLQFSTNINKVQTPNGKLFSPKKVMLHAEDANMVLQDEANPNSLYRMDLETGKVVDEWKVHDDIGVKTFAPDKKYAQMTNEQTFLGSSSNSLYRIDPRLSGNKLVDSQLKQYAQSTKPDFSALATTSNGYIAVASNKGDIRMFDRLGINAKSQIPALGDPIIGLDVSADGRWLLATARTYLLLIDALQHDGKNEGKLGFEKPFAKDSKPKPRRLALKPNHVAEMTHATKAPISFTPAKFNTGVDTNETTIVTATGPFVVSWSMKKVLKGQRDPYSIKRYDETVKADDFKYGTDKDVIVALPNEVGMVSKGALRRPTRESIGGPLQAMSTPARPSRGKSGLRNEIVNSPY